MIAKAAFSSFLCTGFALFCSNVTSAAPQEWPFAKEIRLVVPFPAGGGADTLARILAPELSKNLGQTIIIENISGAGGSLGTEHVIREKSDGYTLLYVTNGTLGTNPALYPNISYRPTQDFSAIGRITQITLVMSTNPKRHQETSLVEFLEHARKSPTPYTFSSSGNGTTSHLAGVLLSSLTGIDFQHIPYRGGAASMTDVLGGRIDFTIDVAPNTLNHVEAGKLTALGVSSRHPLATHPNIRPINETVDNFELFAWDGLVVKSGTDPKIVKQLSQALQKSLKNEKIRASYEARGAQVVESQPEEFQFFIKTESKKWADLVRSSNTKID